VVTTLNRKVWIPKTIRDGIALTEKEEIERERLEQLKHPSPDIALSTSIAMLITQGYGDLRVVYIKGSFTEEIGSSEPTQTKYGGKYTSQVFHHAVDWKNKNGEIMDGATTLDDIFKEEGSFSIEEMVVLQPYEYKDPTSGSIIKTNSYHHFKLFSFKPKIFDRIFGKIPSQQIYDMIKQTKNQWKTQGNDPEALSRIRDTLILSRVNKNTHPVVYTLWGYRKALVLKEAQTFHENGLEIG